MQKLDILMCVPGLPFNGATIKNGSLGGSESAGLYMARSLAKLGHYVTVFSNAPEEGFFDGVRYLKIDHFQELSTYVPHDVCIVQRAPEAFATAKASKLNVLWQHDLALKRDEAKFKGVLWNTDVVFLLSQFHVDQYKEVYAIDSPLVQKTRNGVDSNIFKRSGGERNRKRLFYAARPERGMDVLLEKIMPELLRRDPEITLALAGYDNPVEHMKEFYSHCARLAASFGDRVQWLGALNKEKLAEELNKSGVYVYPTPSKIASNFAEISCIMAMEAAACGLPVVTSARGALPETVGKCGDLIEGNPQSSEYVEKFCDAVMNFITDDYYFEMTQKACEEASASSEWDAIAANWSDLFVEKIANYNNEPERLMRHFMRGSDIVAAKYLDETVKLTSDTRNSEVKRFLYNFGPNAYGFMEAEDGYRKQYEMIGETHDKGVFPHVAGEQRLQVLMDWMKQHAGKFHRVLDYGCAHGSYAVHLSNAIEGSAHIHGVDIDKHSIAIAEEYREKYAKFPGMLKFTTLDDPKYSIGYDCVIAQEVLEHVPEPWKTAEKLESLCNKEGMVYVTVPFGPWEYDSHKTYPHRCHLWHFDAHDLRDMFGSKPGFALGSLIAGNSGLLNAPLGWWIVTYQADGKPVGKIDMGRKMRMQRPRSTVSLNVMAGPNSEQQMEWMLDSIVDLADEIVVADTGMSTRALEICDTYGARIVKAPDPKIHGFETPRNVGLAECRFDYVMWLDTDERLVDPQNLQKYLRDNCFNGYGIKQHHFAVDTTFSPDMPVRVFRRLPNMRWYGMIHEHPEQGVNAGPGTVVVLSDVNIAHTGYLAESGRRKRFMRNFPMLQRDQETYPERILQKHFIMRDAIQLCNYELQMNGGQVTPSIKEKCLNVIDLYRKYFKGSTLYMAIDSLQYYSAALAILGMGIECTYSVDVSLAGGKPGEMRTSRFGNTEEFKEFINNMITEKGSAFESRYY